jgi:Domain of unknown function (DUF4404)
VEQHLRRLLDELSAAIGRTKDHEEREELTRLHGAVEQHLQASGTGSDDGEDGSDDGGDDRGDGEHARLVDVFEKAEIRFESGHPSLAESLRQAIQSLSSAGL